MTRCTQSNTVRAGSRKSDLMASCSDDLETLAAVPVNSPRRGDSLWMRKREFTWATRETAASWRCKWNETIDAHHCFPAGVDIDREFARRNVPAVADAVVHVGRVFAGELCVGRDCDLRPLPWKRESVPDDFDRRA